jgi:DNA-binding MarR family transcriptional regulator
MNFEETASYALARLGTTHRTLLDKYMQGVGLHGGQVFILMELWKKDGQRQTDLAARLEVSAPTVNKILGGLLEAEFVTRARYEDDARSTRIFLTPKGHQIRGVVEEQWAELEANTLIGLTDTEQLIFKQLLMKIRGVQQ